MGPRKKYEISKDLRYQGKKWWEPPKHFNVFMVFKDFCVLVTEI
jgi:hypothetical protein